jgi:glutamate N-acetyltransferase/amino-acid N-acetyltransferase
MTENQSDKARALAELQRRQAEIAAEIAALEADMPPAKGPAVSPFAPDRFPALAPVEGLRLSCGAAGVRYKGRDDVMLAEMAAGSVIAGAFTKSETRSAPVLWCQERIAALAAEPATAKLAIVVNSGNANAFTGRNGREAVDAVMETTGRVLGIPAGNVFMASTGVIGETLPAERVTGKLEELAAALSPDRLEGAARAIMTTDTFPKGSGTVINLDSAPVAISGFAKGSGMIAPDMATMLVFIFTDAAIEQALLQATVSELIDKSFNSITVDSDTSTSDTVLVGATGQARSGKAAMAPIASRDDPRYGVFHDALGEVMRDLAIQVVKDGEGASKIIAITVTGAKSDHAARKIGLAITNSPLVKTAVAGEDPNWGRVVMAVGKSGEAADRDKLSISFGDILVAENGWVAPSYSEELGAAYMKRPELEIGVDVGIGDGRTTVWTCDLTRGYIEINADYRS